MGNNFQFYGRCFDVGLRIITNICTFIGGEAPMNKIFYYGLLSAFLTLLGFSGFSKVIDAKEKERDMVYLKYVPTVTVDERKIEVYEFDQCKEVQEVKEKNPPEPSSCDRVTKEEAVAGQPVKTFKRGSLIEIKNIQSSGELPDKSGPFAGVRRTGTSVFTKDGQSLGPADVKLTYKDLNEEYSESVQLPDEPGYYVGEIYNATPSGSKSYVFHFIIE
jgi:hypothetical protein